jgi:hypothetical protein
VRRGRVGVRVIFEHTVEIGARFRQRHVVADVQRRQLLGQLDAVRRRKRPLREVVRESFCEEVVLA